MDPSGIPRPVDDPAQLWRRVQALEARLGAALAQRPAQHLLTWPEAGSASLNAAAAGDSGWVNAGTALKVQTWGGTVAVTLAARLTVSAGANGIQAAYGFTLTDPNATVTTAADYGRAARVQSGGAAVDANAAFAVVVTGLAPGLYTLQPVARLQDGAGGTAAVSATIANRSLIVQGL